MATPLLPVTQTTAELNWPQNGVMHQRQRPADRVRRDRTQRHRSRAAPPRAWPARSRKTVLLSTVPKQAPKAVDRGLLIERVGDDLLVIVRNTPVVSAPLSQVLSPACQRLTFTAHADKVTGEFVGLVTGPRRRRARAAAARRARRLRLPAADRRRVHRPVRARAARPDVLRHHRLPLQQLADAAEDAGDGARRRDDRRRARRTARAGHRRRRAAPAVPAAALVVDVTARRPGRRGAGVVALRRRQHLRRRLHPDHGPGVRARRLHGQLLPLVRHPRGAVRLVLRPARAVGARQHRQRVGAAAHAGDGAGLLVGDQPRGDPAPRATRSRSAAPRRGPRQACSWRSGCR